MKRIRLFWLFLALLTFAVLCLCICVGSVRIALADTLSILWHALTGTAQTAKASSVSIVLSVRLPRVLAVLLTGAALSLCGAAMQGLLRNPLADGSTLGVSSGASLGAVLAILTGFSIPNFALGGTAVLAMIFAFLSMLAVLSLAYVLDHSLSTGSIVLIGVVFSMFVSALMSLLVTFSGDKLRTVTFWTMGSLSSAGYSGVLLLSAALIVCAPVLIAEAKALNLFSMGETQAFHLGVPVRRTKLTVMVFSSMLIGVCVSVGGCIGFVGLVAPHILRKILGPDHRVLLPACMLGGACFLMLCDLTARILISPIELPIGAVTSVIGAIVFVVVFIRNRKAGRGAC